MDGGDLPEDLEARRDELEREFDEEARKLGCQEPGFARDYVERALETELGCLRWRTPDHARPVDVELLVLLCGMSPQPLLLSTSFVRPRRVMLVGSDLIDGKGREAVEKVDERLREVERAQRDLRLERLDPHFMAASDPVAAYRSLADAIRSTQAAYGIATDRILVDITGGKKTMVAAAYLVCSELGLSSCYIDGKYDERVRMPRPGTAVFERLGDPIAAYRVRELRRVVDLARRGRYAAAEELLGELLEQNLAVGRDALEGDLRRLRWLRAWSERRMSELDGAPDPLGAFGREWAKHAAKRFDLDACARVDKCRLLSAYTLHRLVHASGLYRQGDAHEAFLIAFSACDALADGVVMALLAHNLVKREKVTSYHELLRKVGGDAIAAILADGSPPPDKKVEVAASWKGIGRDVLEAALGHETVRPTRNVLMHGVGEVDERVVQRFFEVDAGGRFVEAVERAFGRAFDLAAARASIETTVGELEDLQIARSFGAGA
ncbi:MAG: hypothetical protein KF729_31135 [Sandaracinaceae bacterium]|nr:hypothetical protein [Sandaracinaceae bacterium]